MPVVFQAKIYTVLDGLTQARQDDILVVTRGSISEHEERLGKVLEKLEQNGTERAWKNQNYSKKRLNGVGIQSTQRK